MLRVYLGRWSSIVLEFHNHLSCSHGCQIILGKEVCTVTLWSVRQWHCIPWQVFMCGRHRLTVRFVTHISVSLLPQCRKPQYKCWCLWKPQISELNFIVKTSEQVVMNTSERTVCATWMCIVYCLSVQCLLPERTVCTARALFIVILVEGEYCVVE
jgi:hypothetical protein